MGWLVKIPPDHVAVFGGCLFWPAGFYLFLPDEITLISITHETSTFSFLFVADDLSVVEITLQCTYGLQYDKSIDLLPAEDAEADAVHAMVRSEVLKSLRIKDWVEALRAIAQIEDVAMETDLHEIGLGLLRVSATVNIKDFQRLRHDKLGDETKPAEVNAFIAATKEVFDRVESIVEFEQKRAAFKPRLDELPNQETKNQIESIFKETIRRLGGLNPNE